MSNGPERYLDDYTKHLNTFNKTTINNSEKPLYTDIIDKTVYKYGPVGNPGLKGCKGYIGSRGKRGADGNKGKTGKKGAKGYKGKRGSKNGYIGEKGDKGIKGLPGIKDILFLNTNQAHYNLKNVDTESTSSPMSGEILIDYTNKTLYINNITKNNNDISLLLQEITANFNIKLKINNHTNVFIIHNCIISEYYVQCEFINSNIDNIGNIGNTYIPVLITIHTSINNKYLKFNNSPIDTIEFNIENDTNTFSINTKLITNQQVFNIDFIDTNRENIIHH